MGYERGRACKSLTLGALCRGHTPDAADAATPPLCPTLPLLYTCAVPQNTCSPIYYSAHKCQITIKWAPLCDKHQVYPGTRYTLSLCLTATAVHTLQQIQVPTITGSVKNHVGLICCSSLFTHQAWFCGQKEGFIWNYVNFQSGIWFTYAANLVL